MSFLAVFVLSVALMAYFFFSQPIMMLFDGHRGEAAKFFLQTVGIFAGATALLIFTAVVVGSIGIDLTNLQ